MLKRTMKSIGAAAVFLAVINLLTVSSSTVTATDPTSSQISGSQLSSTALPESPLNSNSPTQPSNHESSPTIVSTLSANIDEVSRTSTSRDTTIITVSSPTEEITREPPVNDLNKNVNTTTTSDKVSPVPQKEESGLEAPSTETSTETSGEAQTKPTLITNDTIVDAETATQGVQEVPHKEASTETSGNAETKPAISKKEPEKQDSIDDEKRKPDTSNKAFKIGAGCVAAVIVIIVFVVIYKICEKKTPAPENAEVKASSETKENVKLLSVKTEPPNSDLKRTSSNQMECIEC